MTQTTYRWNGRYQRGAMATRRAVKQNEAEERNTCPQRWATRPSCGHNHYDPQYRNAQAA